MSSINQIHTAAGLDPPGRSELVRRALSGIRRIRATPPSRRAPLLLADIRGLVDWLTLMAGGWPAGVAAHQAAAGHPSPGADPQVRAAVGRPPTEPAPIAPEIRSRVDTALRMLPSRGWTGGLFGQRDRCLLVLSQLARIPHQQLATLTAGDIAITGVVATITGADRTWTVEAGADPVLCGPCAIARWLTTHQIIVTKIATRAVADHLDRLKPLTGESSHVCREPFSVSDRAASGPLLAPVTEWGHAPFPLSPMSRTPCLGRPGTLLEGSITVHRTLPAHSAAVEESSAPAQPEAVAAGYTKEQSRAAWYRRRADLAHLADVADGTRRCRATCRRSGPADQ